MMGWGFIFFTFCEHGYMEYSCLCTTLTCVIIAQRSRWRCWSLVLLPQFWVVHGVFELGVCLVKHDHREMRDGLILITKVMA